MVRLGTLTNIRTGKLDANASSETGKYPFFTCSKEPLKIDTYSYDCECVLVAGNGDLNVKYYKGKFDAYQRTYIIESIDTSVLYVPYLYLILDNYLDTLRAQSIGGVIKYIKLGNLTEAEIPLPPLVEQQKIAAELDKTSGLIAKRKRQIEKLDLLVKAKFVEMFGDPVTNPMEWEEKKLGDILSVMPQNGMYKPQSEYVNDMGGTPILRIDAFYNGRVTDYSTLKRLRCSEKDIEKYKLFENDIVINRVNSLEYLGKCAHIKGMEEDTVFESNMMRFHPDESKYNSIYLTHLLCTDYVYEQIISHAKKAVNQASINQTDVQDFNLYKVPLPLQIQFADFVQKTELTKTTMQKSLTGLETLYKARMQEYFE